MSRETSIQRIAHWLDDDEEPLLYEPDCGPYWDSLQASRLPKARLVWPSDDPLGFPMLDASED